MIRKFGRIESPPDDRDFVLGAFFSPLMQVRKRLFPFGYKVWDVDRILDQGETQHCIGFAFAGFGNTEPIFSNFSNHEADALYYVAREYDGLPIDEYGTTLRSGAKAFRKAGRIDAYAFTRSVNEIAEWIFEKSPVVVGTHWYSAMMETDAEGFVSPEGYLMGGHAWTIIGCDFRGLFNRHFIGLNSWGEKYGANGRFKIRAGDLARLLRHNGEAVTAVELPLVPQGV